MTFFSLINLCTTFFFSSCRIYFVHARGQSLSCIYRILLLFTLFLLEKKQEAVGLELKICLFKPAVFYVCSQNSLYAVDEIALI